jgi:thioredoxin reductase (NADPH)
MRNVDLLVVGAGPAGISLAAEARAAGVQADAIQVLEKGREHSWAIRVLYPETKLVTANYKGIDARCEGVLCLADSSKSETLTYLDRAIAEHEVRVQYETEVFAIDVNQPPGTGFIVRTNRGDYGATVVVIAIGIFGRPNKPDYALPRTLKDRVLFDVTSVAMQGEQVLVVGGGDSASEYCQYLSGQGNRVTLSYRKSEFSRMLELNRDSLLALEARQAVEVLRGSNIQAVEDDAGRPRVVFVEAGPRVFDRVVYALGGTTPHNFLKTIGVRFAGDQPGLEDGFETSVPGLFLSGDLTAGRKGGSIISAFNASHQVMKQICDKYLGCQVVDRPLGAPNLPDEALGESLAEGLTAGQSSPAGESGSAD